MARKTDEERLLELEKKMEQMKSQKLQVENRIKEKEKKERTRRLIQVGAIFESYFGFEAKENDPLTKEKAEQIALGISKYVKGNKDKFLKINVEKSKEQDTIVYEEEEEHVFVPDEHKDNPYKLEHLKGV